MVVEISGAIDRVAAQIVDAGFHVHQALGPGLLESAYEECLAFELSDRNIAFQRQLAMPISYNGRKLDAGYRIDLLVASCVVVEVKAVEALTDVHQAQLLTYLKLSGLPPRLPDELQREALQDGRPPLGAVENRGRRPHWKSDDRLGREERSRAAW